MPEIRLSAINEVFVPVTRRTVWVFLEITDADGASTVVEATKGNLQGNAVVELVRQLFPTLRNRPIENESKVCTVLGIDDDQPKNDFMLATAISCLRSAVTQLNAIHNRVSLTEELGGVTTEKVPLYGNINRALLGSRSPSAFGEMAERAAAMGFMTVKCAPFDEVNRQLSVDESLQASELGLARVAAVRSAIGDQIDLLVDCHSRFLPEVAGSVANRLAELNIGWFEEPFQPKTDADRLSELSKNISVTLAGAEGIYGKNAFVDLVEQGSVSVIMPDVKHCGGISEAVAAGRASIALGADVSLHSPSGPVSQLESAHVTAAIPGERPLEHAIGESEWRSELLEPAERISNGYFHLPEGDGLGAELNLDAIRRHGGEIRGQ
ncbi:MAG: mandelate racemase/muconate lactonizing enzyme family protein [Chloroflexota bacterium]|nr:mandelate racemase/muconate lactonizing enzyme family protein [Chloroflexota bacterium]